MPRHTRDGEGSLAFADWKSSTHDLSIACKANGVPVVSMCGLRHVFGAWMLDEGLIEGGKPAVAAGVASRSKRLAPAAGRG